MYLTQTEKQEETPGVGALKTEETILQASSRIREEKRELEDRQCSADRETAGDRETSTVGKTA